ncbi:PIN domain-containing protein [Flavobacterium sp.]|jgi:predicted nucleic acid-binding protein|uniref:type II toxin-antitoxin system VapC family toxin n=1 Tax=unclassified Flavobacterium TaxID=196869 RepID=UPI0022C7D88D|nr:PIN domain-containing protein [Flavobacterium sp.]MCZ8227996.1 PIN domain-containing protein [Flavobacterium sp.]
MRNIFIDINILVDIFANREPFVHKSLSIYNLAIKRKIKLYSSSNTITTLHYILKKSISEEKTRLALEHVIEHVLIIPVDINIIKKSLKSNHKDFEDAIQITSAQSINTIECIVTRDLKDYKNAEINVLSPDEFLNTL